MAQEFHRTDRIASFLKRELSHVIQYEMRDPRVGMVTISAVKVARDLSNAKVYISLRASQQEIDEVLGVLNKAAGFLRSAVAKKLNARTTPALRFVYDKSIVEGQRLSKLIDDVHPVEDDNEPD